MTGPVSRGTGHAVRRYDGAWRPSRCCKGSAESPISQANILQHQWGVWIPAPYRGTGHASDGMTEHGAPAIGVSRVAHLAGEHPPASVGSLDTGLRRYDGGLFRCGDLGVDPEGAVGDTVVAVRPARVAGNG